MTFIYTVHRAGRAVSVVATGEIDVTVAGGFGTALCQLAEAEPTDRIEVDLAGLRFIDSTGTAALKRAHRISARCGCVLVATNATGIVRRVLDLTGTSAHLSPPTNPDLTSA
ncbi:MAG: anti-sigma factor antagonist [Micromonosporaceae bacterium]|jgi:anti-anti-sigma factor|nr:anti-sigma factor antagonist [Micromonosporaceae bacterium]